MDRSRRARGRTLFILTAIICLSVIPASASERLEKEWKADFRPKLMDACLGSDLSKGSVTFCNCCVDKAISDLTVTQLKDEDYAFKYIADNVMPLCDAGLQGELLQKQIQAAMTKQPEKTPEAAAQEPPKPAPPADPQSTVFLTNGQVMTCRIVSKEKNGIWVEVEGEKVFFNSNEVKKIQ